MKVGNQSSPSPSNPGWSENPIRDQRQHLRLLQRAPHLHTSRSTSPTVEPQSRGRRDQRRRKWRTFRLPIPVQYWAARITIAARPSSQRSATPRAATSSAGTADGVALLSSASTWRGCSDISDQLSRSEARTASLTHPRDEKHLLVTGT